jgi:hypothetical protein
VKVRLLSFDYNWMEMFVFLENLKGILCHGSEDRWGRLENYLCFIPLVKSDGVRVILGSLLI